MSTTPPPGRDPSHTTPPDPSDRTGTDDVGRARATWGDPTRTVSARVEALLAVMTTTEKVAQLGSTWHREHVGAAVGDGPAHDQSGAEAADHPDGREPGVAPMEEAFGPVQDWDHVRTVGIGHLTRTFGTSPTTATAGLARLAELQQDFLDHARLGIPAIAHEECLTGFTTLGATVQPTPLALAATFDPDLVGRVADRIGADLRAVDVHQALSPVLDVVVDPRWGRTEETFGADPLLVATMATAYVAGLEARGVVATLKHFAGHAASRAGRNHAPVAAAPRELADVHLVPFEWALRHGGARSVMNSYADVDGVPPAVDATLLTDLLRDDWGFTGTVVSDYGSIGFLVDMHRVARDLPDAAEQALAAGIDVELPESHGFHEVLVSRVERGEVPVALVDRAVRRVLAQKVELGLLDHDWTPRTSTDVDLDGPANRRVAREAARASVVVLANDGMLPLATPPARLAVLGPGADDPGMFLGCYSYPNHVLPRHPGLGLGIPVDSVVAAARARWPDHQVAHVRGCPVVDALDPTAPGAAPGPEDGTDDDPDELAAAVEAATAADLVVLVLGDQPGMFGRGTSGEGNDATDLRLPGRQADLADRVLATGTPVVLVVVSGRPYALRDLPDRAVATVQSFLPGAEGGTALVEVLAGDVDPTGRLPIEVPTEPGGQPASHRHPVLGEVGLGISSADVVPAFPFGHGLAWTSFAFDDLEASATTMATDGTVEVSCTVGNTGDHDGTAVAQLYLDDPVAEVARPVRELLGFARVPLSPGDRARVTFTVHADRLSYTGRAGARIVDAGRVTFRVGPSSGDLPLAVDVDVTGPTRRVGHDRVLDTPATVHPTPVIRVSASRPHVASMRTPDGGFGGRSDVGRPEGTEGAS